MYNVSTYKYIRSTLQNIIHVASRDFFMSLSQESILPKYCERLGFS